MEISAIKVDNEKGYNLVIGSAHFIMTPEDIADALMKSTPSIKYGLSFCEASGPALIRSEGNDDELLELSRKNALKIAAGHTFILFVKDAYPINFINSLKNLSEVSCIYCATANPLQVIVATTDQGKALLGVVDGFSPMGLEDETQRKKRFEFLRKIGYKLTF
ncbi:adenosine-specific kinase [candidate division WOR-3 bacterium]|nr:adenosine-specific kinase [candidate division WOR-3 bacterium]